MLKRIFLKCWLFWWQVLSNFVHDGCLYRASALTFTSLLALVPLMVVGLSVFSAFPLFSQFSQEIQDFVFNNFLPSSGDAIQRYIIGFVDQASNLSVWGTAFLTITAVLMLFTIEQAMNVIWRVKKRRGGISAFVIYWAILTLSPFLMGLSFFLSTYVISLAQVTDAARTLGVASYLVTFTTFTLSTVVLSLLYIVIPNCRVPIRFGLLGAIVASILVEFAKYGFSQYLIHFHTYQLVYGALATIPIFLIWLYFLWLITLLGAVISRSLALRYDIVSRVKLDPFCQGFRWIGHLWHAQQKGKPLTLLGLVKIDRCQYEVSPEEQLWQLQKAGFIQQGEKGRYFVSCDLSGTTLYEFYQRMPWKLPVAIRSIGRKVRELSLGDCLSDASLKLEHSLSPSLAQLLRPSK